MKGGRLLRQAAILVLTGVTTYFLANFALHQSSTARYNGHNETEACAANLRRIGAAAALYAQDNNGWWPPVADSTRESNINGNWYPGAPQLWRKAISGYLAVENKKAVFNCPVGHSPYTMPDFAPKTYGTKDGVFRLNSEDSQVVWLTDAVDRAGDQPKTVHGPYCNTLKVDGTVTTVKD